MISGKDARNATYHKRIWTTPQHYVFENTYKPKNISKFRAFRCRVFMYLKEDCRKRQASPEGGRKNTLRIRIWQQHQRVRDLFPSTGRLWSAIKCDSTIQNSGKQSIVDQHNDRAHWRSARQHSEGRGDGELGIMTGLSPGAHMRRYTMILLQMS